MKSAREEFGRDGEIIRINLGRRRHRFWLLPLMPFAILLIPMGCTGIVDALFTALGQALKEGDGGAFLLAMAVVLPIFVGGLFVGLAFTFPLAIELWPRWLEVDLQTKTGILRNGPFPRSRFAIANVQAIEVMPESKYCYV